MFDRTTSQSWHLRSAPVASIATLANLAAVLNDVVAARDRSSELQDSGAAWECPELCVSGPVHGV